MDEDGTRETAENLGQKLHFWTPLPLDGTKGGVRLKTELKKCFLGHWVQKLNSAFPLLGQAREENIWKKDRKLFSVPHPSLHESTEEVLEIEFQSPLVWLKKDALSIQMQKINSALPPLSKRGRHPETGQKTCFCATPSLHESTEEVLENESQRDHLHTPPLRCRPRSNAGIRRSNGMQVSGVLE